MKNILTIVYILVSQILLGQSIKTINPTGTYKLNAHVDRTADEIKEYYGYIQIFQFHSDSLLVNFYINKGHPSYNSGSFFDTLVYVNNQAEFTTEMDSSCLITMTFSSSGLLIKHVADDYNFSCGFGRAVIANEYYDKTSSSKPIFIDYNTGLKL